jgi:hypothetical protein
LLTCQVPPPPVAPCRAVAILPGSE